MVFNTTRELKQVCKEYYISIGQFHKSDRIQIVSVVSDFTFDFRYKLRVRKCFSEGNTYSLYLNKKVLEDWYTLKLRTEKILKIKSKINQK